MICPLFIFNGSQKKIKKAPTFLKLGLCHFIKILYLYKNQIVIMVAKIHFREYNPKQMVLFPERLDKDIDENDPVRVVDTVVDSLKISNFDDLYSELGRSPYHPKMMMKTII